MFDYQISRNSFLSFQILTFAFFCISSNLSYAHGQTTDGKHKTVVAEGTGKSESQAKKEAFREAIRKVVGVLIDAKTQVKNDNVIQEEVLEYSGGFIRDYKILSTKKDANGLFIVQAECQVEINRVREKLDTLKITTVKVDGDKFNESQMSKEELQKNAAQFISKALEERKALFQVVFPKKLEDLPKEESGGVKIPAYIDFDNDKFKTWVLKWKPVFEKLCTRKQSVVTLFKSSDRYETMEMDGQDNDFFWNEKGLGSRREKVRIWVGEGWSNNQQGITVKYTVFDIATDATQFKGIKFVKWDNRLIIDDTTKGKIKIELVDKDGLFVAGSETTNCGTYKNIKTITLSPNKTEAFLHDPIYLFSVAEDRYSNSVPKSLIISSFPGDSFRGGRYHTFPPKSFGTNFNISIPKSKLATVDKMIGSIEWQDVETDRESIE